MSDADNSRGCVIVRCSQKNGCTELEINVHKACSYSHDYIKLLPIRLDLPIQEGGRCMTLSLRSSICSIIMYSFTMELKKITNNVYCTKNNY